MKRAFRSRFFRGNEARGLGYWVAQKCGVEGRGFDRCTALAVFRKDTLHAALIFHDYNPEAATIEISVAAEGPGWLSRRLMAQVNNYVFERANCRLLLLRTSEKNKHVNRVARSLGFRGTAIPDLRGPNEAEIIWTLDRQKALSSPYVRMSHGST